MTIIFHKSNTYYIDSRSKSEKIKQIMMSKFMLVNTPI